MGKDMKENGKMARSMVKVRKSDWLNYLLILTLFNSLIIGKYFYDNGERYEGEWEYGMKYG